MTTTFPLVILAPAAPFFLASLISLGGIIYRARKAAREAEEKARAQARQEAEAIRRKQEAATRKAKQEAEAAAIKAEAQAARKVKAAEAARIKELHRKMSAAELLKGVPTDSKPFAGQKIAFSGRFPRVERSQLIQVVNALGGYGHETTHAGTTMLVLCPRSGKGQIDRAEHWKIPTIAWDEWYKQAFGKDPGPEFTAAIN